MLEQDTFKEDLKSGSGSNGADADADADLVRRIAQETLPKAVVLPYLIVLRIINALTINTFFQADEYWQSLEPAHVAVFGYGHLTWEWRVGLRGYLHPFLFSLVYDIADILDLGDLGVIYLPKITQGIIAAIGEYHMYKFVKNYTKNEKLARVALLLSVISSFNWYVITRTFSNSLELTLTSIALGYWFDRDSMGIDKGLLFAAVSCFLRPTNGLIWIVLGVSYLIHHSFSQNLTIILKAILYTTVVLLLNIVIDYQFYGKLTIPIWNFIQFNVISSLSKFYGVAPWHFHIFQSVPIILMTALPFFLYGILKSSYKEIKILLVFVISIFSTIDHKEFRFLYPLQPFMFLIAAYGIYHLNFHHPSFVKYSLITIVVIDTAISLFFTQIHERGVIDVVEYLREDPDVKSIGFLTPCHSTPWQSHLHRDDIDTWFLTCEPPLHLLTHPDASKEVEGYKDESDIFYEDPELFMFKNLPPPFKKELRSPGIEYKFEWPTHLVFFGDLEPVMVEYLKDSPYEECQRFFNTWFHWDDRRRGDVIVYCKWPWE